MPSIFVNIQKEDLDKYIGKYMDAEIEEELDDGTIDVFFTPDCDCIELLDLVFDWLHGKKEKEKDEN